MSWPGLQHSDGAGNLVFASHLNTKAMQERGNKVINGCEVTEQSPTPDLTVEVESGNVIANGIVVAVDAIDPFAGTPVTFATTQGNLLDGEAEFVMIHVDSSGVITNSEGGAATAGQQLPPEVPEDEVLLAMITLTEGDSQINTDTDIEDWRQFVPDGGYFSGSVDIGDHNLSTIGLKLAGTLVTSSAAELNVLDGVTGFSGTPENIGTSNDAGTDTIIPRLDHVHDHVSGLGSDLHHTRYALTEDLISNEIAQLQNIDTETISNAEWAILADIAPQLNKKQNTSMASYVHVVNGCTKVEGVQSPMINFPETDVDCYTVFGLLLPASVTTTPTLHVLYLISGSTAYSVKWSISCMKDGDNTISGTIGNVLNESTSFDFPAGTTWILYEKTIPLDDTDIRADSYMGIKIQSDASNTNWMRIASMWLTW